MKSTMSRRRFLQAALAACTAPQIIPARVLGLESAPPANNKIAIGVIGLGGRGNDHLGSLLGMSDVQVAAVCDVYRAKAEAAKNRVDAKSAGCTAYGDFRELLARPDIDAVFITSPENWHVLMAIAAMKAGKDVYCEKALSLTVREGRAVCAAVRRYGRVFQAGTQQRSDGRFRFACELARNGYLGNLHTVTVGVPSGRRVLHCAPQPVPDGLDYDLWLGPAAFKPYRDNLCSYNWYFFTDYCAGWIQSWGVHHVDIALWGAPALCANTVTVEGAAEFVEEGDADVSFGWQTKIATPDGLVLRFHDDASSPVGHGVRFEGDKGWVHVDRGRLFAKPVSLLSATLTPGDERLYRSDHHQINFLQCLRTRRDPAAPVEACHAATTATLIADIATRLGRKLTWDWRREEFVNDDTANRALSRAMRSPWQI